MNDRTHVERIAPAIRFIELHLDSSFDLKECAAASACCPYHFHRLFKAVTGETVMSYVRRLRLERAAMQLSHTSRSILRIALDAGYESNEAFTRAFQRQFNVAPKNWRKGQMVDLPDNGCGKDRFHMSGSSNPPDVTIVRIPAARIAVQRHVGPYDEAGIAWNRLMSSPAGRQQQPDGLRFGICYDDPSVTDENRIRYEACLEVVESFEPPSDQEVRQHDGGLYARLRYTGPYTAIDRAFDWLYAVWLPASRYELVDSPSLIMHRNSPVDTAPEDLITDIHMPVEPW